MQTPDHSTAQPLRYLIIGRARSGTTLTHLLLMGHPQVSALNDELRPEPLFTQGIRTFTFGNDSPEEKSQGMRRLFDALTQTCANKCTKAAGAKTVINDPALASQVVTNIQTHMPDLKIIHIVRDDLVALFGSGVQGRKSGVMHSWYKEFGNQKVEKITIPKASFHAFAHSSLQASAAIRKLSESHDYLEFSYESFLSERAELEVRLLKFLDLDLIDIDWVNSEKVMPAPGEYINNYAQAAQWNADIAAHVEGSQPDKQIDRLVLLGKIQRRFKR